MCGYVGGFYLKPKAAPVSSFTDALAELSHRGPDDQGLEVMDIPSGGSLCLAHARLAILDLSDAGKQPMSSKSGKFKIIFNGEIYNFKELREELSQLGFAFETETDTEVLLAALECWGTDCLPRLVGMFSFCLWDVINNKLILVRDAFGIKPLFYRHTQDSFTFGSEIKPVITVSDYQPEVDLEAAYHYLVHSDYDANDKTLFAGLQSLPPASYVEYDFESGVLSSPVCWWQPDIAKRSEDSFNEAAAKVKDIFLRSVKLHLRSDVPVGAALSGGIDSSAIVCAIRHLEPDMRINTFSYIAEGSVKSEEPWVDIVNAKTDAVPHKVVASQDELLRDLNDMIAFQGEPFRTTSIYAQYRVFQAAREAGVVVTLDGQGADELLAGYLGYPGERLLSLLEQHKYKKALRFLRNWSKATGQSMVTGLAYFLRKVLPDRSYGFMLRLKGIDFEPGWLNLRSFKASGIHLKERRPERRKKFAGRRVVEQLIYSIKGRGLPALLRHGDRNSMRFSIESRVPFLTIEMAEYLYSLPEEFLISEQGVSKNIFREAMRGIVPDTVLARTDKIGFEMADENWHEFFSLEINRKYQEISAKTDAINRVFDKSLPSQIGRCDMKQKWRILNFLYWYDMFIASRFIG